MQSDILKAADELVDGDRQLDYGHPFQDFTKIARMWEGYLSLVPGTIEPEDVAMMMINVKQSRIRNTPGHIDSAIDIAGYDKCLELIRAYRVSHSILHPKDKIV